MSFVSFQLWTPELCRKDSDGDGKTNGEELGDPKCVWNGNAPDGKAVSHPGNDDDYTKNLL
jgi:dopamine beta-monooxygenase